MVLTEGWDLPAVACGILARPTKKMGLYRQMIGRLLRPAPGKFNAIVLDHSGAVFRHGFVEDPVEWTLDAEKRAASPAHAARLAKGHPRASSNARNAARSAPAAKPCEHCGFLPQRPPRAIVFGEGDLGLVDRKSGAVRSAFDPHERMRWLAMLYFIERERGYRRTWARVNYREKFGTWPPYGSPMPPMEPTPEVLSWVRSRMIAYAKARQKAGAG